MSWFKSCAVALLLVMCCLFVKGQTVDCNSPNANTPRVRKYKAAPPSYCYGNSGYIELSVYKVGGNGNDTGDWSEWEFSLDGGSWDNDGFYTNVSAGTHIIVLRNINTGCQTETTIDLGPAFNGGEPIINYISVTEASFCANDGQIVVDADNPAPGGYFDLRYRLNGGAWTTSNTFNNLAGGNYTIEVGTSDGRCISSQMATVPKLTPHSINSITTTASNSCSTPMVKFKLIRRALTI